MLVSCNTVASASIATVEHAAQPFVVAITSNRVSTKSIVIASRTRTPKKSTKKTKKQIRHAPTRKPQRITVTPQTAAKKSSTASGGLDLASLLQESHKRITTSSKRSSRQTTKQIFSSESYLTQESFGKGGKKKNDGALNSSSSDDVEQEIITASKKGASSLSGRNVVICITGVDSRLGVTQRHADANHILRIWLDKGEIEIFSVPRGTPVSAGFNTKSMNYLANLRSNKGRDAYHKKMIEITGVGRIDYWMELGFSQAMGVMELLGFKDNAKTALRVIRSRKAFRTGDYQRCYNQSQFIKQMILRHFGKSSGFMGGMALRSALGIVETNLKFDMMKNIIEDLQAKGFPKNSNAVTIKVRPAYRPEIQHIDFSDDASISIMNAKLEKSLTQKGFIGHGKKPAFNENKYEDQLEIIVKRGEKQYKSNPQAAINTLRRVYEQRAWLQITDKSQRMNFFKRICLTLIESYKTLGYAIEQDNVQTFYDGHLESTAQESAAN